MHYLSSAYLNLPRSPRYDAYREGHAGPPLQLLAHVKPGSLRVQATGAQSVRRDCVDAVEEAVVALVLEDQKAPRLEDEGELESLIVVWNGTLDVGDRGVKVQDGVGGEGDCGDGGMEKGAI